MTGRQCVGQELQSVPVIQHRTSRDTLLLASARATVVREGIYSRTRLYKHKSREKWKKAVRISHGSNKQQVWTPTSNALHLTQACHTCTCNDQIQQVIPHQTCVILNNTHRSDEVTKLEGIDGIKLTLGTGQAMKVINDFSTIAQHMATSNMDSHLACL